ncbi:MAG: glycoside hydrolase family 127 protein [Ignavibacteriales bacterium]|nr:glycoside hydrolase family 127 protein [Ignavibacteriales bacterium]
MGDSGCGLRGHFTGHYLSACATLIKSEGDSLLAKRINYMIGELQKCQEKTKREIFKRLS